MNASNQPLVSIILAVYNGGKTLSNCLNSIENQTYSEVELIVIDGGSTDQTVNILEVNESLISYWISESDSGIYDAWNKGVKQANGEWVCFIGADDYFWHDKVMEQLVNTAKSLEPEVKLVYGSVAIVNDDNECLYFVGEPWESAKRKLGGAMSVPHPGMLHHYSWFEKYGMFNTSFHIAGDYEMLLRGWPEQDAVFVSGLTSVGMMQGGVSSTPRNAIKQLKEVWRAQKIHGKKLPSLQMLLAMSRVYLRLVMQMFLTKRATYRLLDFGRKLSGKPPYWTKL